MGVICARRKKKKKLPLLWPALPLPVVIRLHPGNQLEPSGDSEATVTANLSDNQGTMWLTSKGH